MRDRVVVSFFSGNQRRGILVDESDPEVITISPNMTNSVNSNTGTFNISEVQWIECNGRVVYP